MTDVPDNNIKVNQLTIRRQILDWRDRNMMIIASHLQRELPTLLDAIEKKYQDISYKQLFVGRQSFIKENVEPVFQDWVSKEAGILLQNARKEIDSLVVQSTRLGIGEGEIEYPEQDAPVKDTALTAATIAAGIGGVPATVALSASSYGGILGLIGLSSISWPIVIVGFGISTVVLAFGTHKAAVFKERAIEKHVQQVESFAKARVLCSTLEEDTVCERLQDLIRVTARKLVQELNL